jgi:hypothetical protein
MTRADEIATAFGASAGSEGEPGPAADPQAGTPAPADADRAVSAPRHNGHRSRHELDLQPGDSDLGATGRVDVSRVAAPADAPPDPEPASETEEVIETSRAESLPELARHAAGMWLKAAGWTAGTSLRVGNELRKIATDPNGAQEVIEEVTKEVREVARDFLGITELDAEVREIAPLLSTGMLKAGGSSPEALRAQGAQLLREAADVGFDEGAHPAFARILTELSPDEARILRLLAIEGPQPMVDVRAHNLIGNGSQLIAQSLNMLGPKAGLRQRERVLVYLTNLVRCNLVVMSDDPLESPVQYQVLEAQPEVLSTTRDTVRAKLIRRSVHLTPLGQEFCEVCLPVNLPALPPPSDG